MTAAEVFLAAISMVGLALTIWAVAEVVRARAFSWLVGLLFWPAGTIAWFVAGRRLYRTEQSPPPGTSPV